MTTVLDRTLEPGESVAFPIEAGARLWLGQVEGDQVADLISFVADDLDDRLSMSMSRAVNGAWKLTAPHTLVSTGGRDLWTIEEDTLQENYCGGGYCNPYTNERRYGDPGAATCEGNLVGVLAPYGFTRRSFDPDTCFNIFMRVDYEPDGQWAIRETPAKVGDHIVLRAECDQLVGLSNCPQVLSPVNNWSLKHLALRVES